MSYTVTGSIDETLITQAPGALGILARGSLREAMPIVMEARSRAPLLPIYICCSKEEQAACGEILEACADIELIQSVDETPPAQRVNEILWRSSFRRTMIIWSDAALPDDPAGLLAAYADDHTVCRVPCFLDPSGSPLPTQVIPVLEQRVIRMRHIPPLAACELDTAFVHDYIGIYDTPLFRTLGGFELSFRSAYWQQLDFGTRSFLWGYRTAVMPDFTMQAHMPLQASTVKDRDYLRWYRRNCSLYRGTKGIRLNRSLMRGNDEGESSWVREHRHRFVMAMDDLVRTWEGTS